MMEMKYNIACQKFSNTTRLLNMDSGSVRASMSHAVMQRSQAYDQVRSSHTFPSMVLVLVLTFRSLPTQQELLAKKIEKLTGDKAERGGAHTLGSRKLSLAEVKRAGIISSSKRDVRGSFNSFSKKSLSSPGPLHPSQRNLGGAAVVPVALAPIEDDEGGEEAETSSIRDSGSCLTLNGDCQNNASVSAVGSDVGANNSRVSPASQIDEGRKAALLKNVVRCSLLVFLGCMQLIILPFKLGLQPMEKFCKVNQVKYLRYSNAANESEAGRIEAKPRIGFAVERSCCQAVGPFLDTQG